MVEVEISVQLLGVLSSVVAAGFSLIPALGATTARRAATAIVVLIAGVFIESGMAVESWATFFETFLAAAIYAVGTYAMFLQPIVKPTVAYMAEGLTARVKG